MVLTILEFMLEGINKLEKERTLWNDADADAHLHLSFSYSYLILGWKVMKMDLGFIRPNLQSSVGINPTMHQTGF